MYTRQYKIPTTFEKICDDLLGNIVFDEIESAQFKVVCAILLSERTKELPLSIHRETTSISAPNPKLLTPAEFNIIEFRRNGFATIKQSDVSELFEEAENWRELNDLAAFAKSRFLKEMRFFINEEEHKTCILLSTNEDFSTQIHLISELLTRLLPWRFEEQKITEWETKFIYSLDKNSPDDTNALIAEFFSKPEFETKALKAAIERLTSTLRVKQISDQEARVKEAQETIDNYTQALERLWTQYREANIRLNGLRMEPPQVDSGELYSYLNGNKNISIVDTDGSLSFIARGYLTQVDADIFEEYDRNRRSYLWNQNTSSYLPVFRKNGNHMKLMRALFSSSPKLKLRTVGYYCFDGMARCCSQRGYLFPPEDYDRLPNPHLQFHACLGEYKILIEQHLHENDIVGAIDACLASVSSLNISEDATVNPFMKALFSSTLKCIEDENGAVYTPEEALKLIGGCEESDSDGDIPEPEDTMYYPF